MLGRIIISMAMTAVLFVAPMDVTARSCILHSEPAQQAGKPGCCANKTRCATSSEHKSTPAHPLTKADSSYKVSATPVAVATASSPCPEFGTQRFALSNAASGGHSPPTLAL